LCFAQEQESAYQLNSQGMDLYEQKKFQESITEFEEACSLQFDYVYPHYNLACVLSMLAETNPDYTEGNNYVNLQAHLLIALALSPEHRNKWKVDPDLRWFRSTKEGQFLLKNSIKYFNSVPEGFIFDNQKGEFLGFYSRSENLAIYSSQNTDSLTQEITSKDEFFAVIGYYTDPDDNKWYLSTYRGSFIWCQESDVNAGR
jgi:hypothetical protein